MAGMPAADPLTAFAGGFGSGLGQGVGDGIGGSMKPAPSVSGAQLATYGTTIGNDGWTVNFGNAASVSSAGGLKSNSAPPMQQADYLGLGQARPQQAGVTTWLGLALLGVVAVKLIKK